MNWSHEELVKLTLSDLSMREEALKSIKPNKMMTRSFKMEDIKKVGFALKAVEEWLPEKEWKQVPALYVISADSEETATVLTNGFEQTISAAKKVYNRPKRNRRHALSKCLYVGSSLGNVSVRLRQHLYECKNLGTYGLQLNRWISHIGGLPKGHLDVMLWTFNDPSGLGVLQNIEDCLWQELKPLFGKRGAR